MLKGSPTSHIYFSQRLRLHYVDWGNEDAPTLLLVHGGRDHCRNWDWVAERLRDDYHIIAPDLRGHGDSQWMIGGGYQQIDYVYDIAQLLKQSGKQSVAIISHSLGASVSLLYAGLFPETVTKLVAIEGMLATPMRSARASREQLQSRLRNWVGHLRHLSGRIPRRYPTLEEAFHRMQTENPHLTEEQARHLTIHGSNQNEDGSYSWKFDNYVRASNPVGLSADESWQVHQCIECPTLLVYGTESWAVSPERDGRTDAFQNVSVRAIEEAGHWCHHDQLDEFVDIVSEFLAT